MIGRKAAGFSVWSIAIAFALTLLFTPGVQASGDPFTAPNPGPGTVVIQGNWQFHLGDDLGWSKPAFDDSGWEQLSTDTTWGDQTHPGYTGFAWYRKQLHITGRPGKIAVLIPPVNDAYEVFWNGERSASSASCPRMRGGGTGDGVSFSPSARRRWMGCWRCGFGTRPCRPPTITRWVACERLPRSDLPRC